MFDEPLGNIVDIGVSGQKQGPSQNVFVDGTKNWTPNAHRNRLIRIYKGLGAGQLRLILGNTESTLVIFPNWNLGLDPTSHYIIIDSDLMQILRDVFGGGANISTANPLPVGIASSAMLTTRNPFTNTGNILPAVARTNTTGRFRMLNFLAFFSVATSNPVTLALDSGINPVYDQPLRVIPMGATQSIAEYFPRNAVFGVRDVITAAWTDDTGGAAIWAITFTWEAL